MTRRQEVDHTLVYFMNIWKYLVYAYPDPTLCRIDNDLFAELLFPVKRIVDSIVHDELELGFIIGLYSQLLPVLKHINDIEQSNQTLSIISPSMAVIALSITPVFVVVYSGSL